MSCVCEGMYYIATELINLFYVKVSFSDKARIEHINGYVGTKIAINFPIWLTCVTNIHEVVVQDYCKYGL